MTELKQDDAAKRLGISRGTFNKIKHDPGFPRPIKISSRRYYIAEELDSWKLKQRA